jgi:hypothetical protein
MQLKDAFILFMALLVGSCTTVPPSPPPRSATDQLLVSTAADRAADSLAQQMPPGLKIFLDISALDGPDAHYAAVVIADRFLRRGLLITTDRSVAQAIVLIRSGALSTNTQSTLVGMPQFAVPFFPVGNLITIPEIDFYKSTTHEGVAEFAATAFDIKTGKLITSTDPQFGFSHENESILFLFVEREKDDLPSGGASVPEQ